MSQSALKVFMQDPQQFYRQYVSRTAPPREPTPSQEFGTAVEDLAFRDTLNYTVIPANVLNAEGHKKGAAWIDYQRRMAAEQPHMTLLKADEFSKPLGPAAVMQAVDNLRGHSFASKLVWGESLKNVRIRWTDRLTGLQCRCEIDILHEAAIIGDLKTAAEVSVQGFHRAVVNFGYHIQAFFYREALLMVAEHLDEQPDSETLRFCRPMLERIRDGENLLCCWVAVKNKPSHHVEVHPCDEAWYSIAEPIVRQKMFELKQAYDTGHWQTASHGKLTNLKPEKWAYNALEQLSLEQE